MANVKWTARTETTTTALTDIGLIVRDPGGTPLSRKLTLQTLAARMHSVQIPLGASSLTGATISLVSSHQVVVFRDSNTDIIDFSLPVPPGWGGKNLTVSAWWAAASGSGNIVTSVETLVVSNGAALSTSATVVSATFAVTTSLVKRDYTIVGLTEGQAMAMRVYRSGSNGSDTLAASAHLCALGIQLA